jgi:GTP-binding protein
MTIFYVVSMTFTLAIVGRPNVGKSTLFNRLAGKKLAIVNDRPGVTRDWREAEAHLGDRQFRIIDTAGLEDSFDDSIQGRMRQKTEAALDQADAVLFMVDGRVGLTPLDKHFAAWLRRQGKPVILGVNKCEGEQASAAGLAEAWSLGLGDPIPLSAEHGHGLADLYDQLTPFFPEEEEAAEAEEEGWTPDEAGLDALEGREDYDFAGGKAEPDDRPLKLAIVGRPNVGKSTLLNALVGHDRVMTGPEAGITRDAIAVQWEFKTRKIRLVDTAGMRKKGKIFDVIEKMAVDDTLRAIRLAQVVVLVLDANVMLEKQDLLIAEHILDEGRALVIAVNKWDTIDDRAMALKKLEDRLEASLAQVPGVPVVTLSALRGANVAKLMDRVLATYETWNKRAATGRLNRWLAGMESAHPAPLVNARANRLRYITQIKTRPPTFAVWVSKPDELPDTYKRYLINGLRQMCDLHGIPLRLLVRTSKNPYVD